MTCKSYMGGITMGEGREAGEPFVILTVTLFVC